VFPFGNNLALSLRMTEFAFAADTPPVLPRHNGSMLVIAAIMHLLLFFVVTQVKMTPVRVSSAGTLTAGIAAYVPGPVGVTPAAIVTPKSGGRKDRAENGSPKSARRNNSPTRDRPSDPQASSARASREPAQCVSAPAGT
jgi:hypothetical protein